MLWGTTAFAKDHMTYLPAPTPIKSLEGIQFVTGGIGVGERKILDRMAEDYSLKVVFTMQDGHYLSQCQVEVIRADGRKMRHRMILRNLLKHNMCPTAGWMSGS